MNYWYTFKLKALFQIDVIDAKNEAEAAEKADKIAGEFVDGLKGLEVLECEGEDQGEIKDQTNEGEEDYEVYFGVEMEHEEVVTAKTKWDAIEQAEYMFLDNITRAQALEVIEENIKVKRVINEQGEVI